MRRTGLGVRRLTALRPGRATGARPVARQQHGTSIPPSSGFRASRILPGQGPGGYGRPASVAPEAVSIGKRRRMGTRVAMSGILLRHSSSRSIGVLVQGRRIAICVLPSTDRGRRPVACGVHDCGEARSGCAATPARAICRRAESHAGTVGQLESPTQRRSRRSYRSRRRIATPTRSPTSSRLCRRRTSARRIVSST